MIIVIIAGKCQVSLIGRGTGSSLGKQKNRDQVSSTVVEEDEGVVVGLAAAQEVIRSGICSTLLVMATVRHTMTNFSAHSRQTETLHILLLPEGIRGRKYHRFEDRCTLIILQQEDINIYIVSRKRYG